MGIGWRQEAITRAAAAAERQRQEMSIKDQNKAHHIILELEKLFTPLEPISGAVKRFCRMEADRAWRGAVRHAKICGSKSQCQLRIKEKGAAVIADAALACSINALLDGRATLEGVSHSSVLMLADRHGALQSSRGSCCALRAVRTVVSTLLLHTQVAPIPACACTISKRVASGPLAQETLPPVNAPFERNNSSLGDIGLSDALQLRDSVSKVFKSLSACLTNRVRDTSLLAIQDTAFRVQLSEARAFGDNGDNGHNDSAIFALSQDALSFCILKAVCMEIETSRACLIPHHTGISFCGDVETLNASVAQIRRILPASVSAASAFDAEADGLFG